MNFSHFLPNHARYVKIVGECGIVSKMYSKVFTDNNWVGIKEYMRELDVMKKILVVALLFCGCTFLSGCGTKQEDTSVPDEAGKSSAEIDVDDIGDGTKMVSYDVLNIGRADPFMPMGEIAAYEQATKAAIAEANAHNAEVIRLTNLKNTAIREADDISPYSFNLPVPPTILGPADTAAAKITRTKVVGIMYSPTSPSAIINVDDKDYLVRQGDKILDNQYKVLRINQNWITVSLGSNIYSAAIGELFSKDELNVNRNDLYNLKNRFGGRKS